ncbi:MAG TPA: transaldolase family protein [Terriglobales bacterium]|nr:transaldolase family protein [Terriglobales bacterium]
MQIFIDSADEKEIRYLLKQGIVDGVTTNPTIMLKDGIHDVEGASKRLSSLLGDRPLSVEVTTNDHQQMLQQARTFATWGRNIVVKVPVVNEFGESSLDVINELTGEAIAVNATAVLSFNQAVLATKAGATYVSIFAGRIADEGNDPTQTIRNVRAWLNDWEYSAKIIVGSVRTAIDIQNAALAGAHIITVPPPFFAKMIDHKYTRDTVRQFNRDAEKALQEIAVAQAASSISGNGK